MPIAKVKLFSAASAAALKTAVDAYAAGAGSQILTDQRAMAMASFFDTQKNQYTKFFAIAHDGTDIPASKTANQQFIALEADSVTALQTALDAALANIVHLTASDGNTTVANTLTSAGAAFAAGDVGRKIRINESGVDQDRVITVRNSATSVTYAGTAFVSGTGKTYSLLGAETIPVQGVAVAVHRERDGDPHYSVFVACEGQIP